MTVHIHTKEYYNVPWQRVHSTTTTLCGLRGIQRGTPNGELLDNIAEELCDACVLLNLAHPDKAASAGGRKYPGREKVGT